MISRTACVVAGVSDSGIGPRTAQTQRVHCLQHRWLSGSSLCCDNIDMHNALLVSQLFRVAFGCAAAVCELLTEHTFQILALVSGCSSSAILRH